MTIGKTINPGTSGPQQPVRMFEYVVGEKTNQGYDNKREVYLTNEELTGIAKDTTKEILQNGVKERGEFNLRERLKKNLDIQEKIMKFLEENKLKENEEVLEAPGIVLRLHEDSIAKSAISEEFTQFDPNDLLIINSTFEKRATSDSSGENYREFEVPHKDIYKAGSLQELKR